MVDFKPVFAEIRAQLKRHALFIQDMKRVARLQPGETMLAREAARTAAQQAVRVKHGELPHFGINHLLTAHRHLRGKPANHGIHPACWAVVTDRVVDSIRSRLATKSEAVPV